MPMRMVGVVVPIRHNVVLPGRGIGDVGWCGYLAAEGRIGSKKGGGRVGRRGAVMPMRVVGVIMPIRHGVVLPRRGIGDVWWSGYLAA